MMSSPRVCSKSLQEHQSSAACCSQPPFLKPAGVHLESWHGGLGLGLCRMIFAILDVTTGIVCIGKVISRPFRQTLGVREGAAESPHAFNLYVSDLRSGLEAAHPRLCRLMDFVIVALLYADDAAMPADSAEDLQLSKSSAMSIAFTSHHKKHLSLCWNVP